MNETIENAAVIEDTAAAIVEKPYKFRKLCSDDIFPMLSIIGAVGVNEFAACISFADFMKSGEMKSDDENTAEYMKMGLNIAGILCKNIPNCRSDIYTLLANVSGMTVEEVSTMDFAVFAEMVIDFVRKEEFRDFIGVFSKLFK
jgi:hypothetical protein